MKVTYRFFRIPKKEDDILLCQYNYEAPNYPPVPRRKELLWLEDAEDTAAFDYYIVHHVEHGIDEKGSLVDIFVKGWFNDSYDEKFGK